jgi:hypothetical protein
VPCWWSCRNTGKCWIRSDSTGINSHRETRAGILLPSCRKCSSKNLYTGKFRHPCADKLRSLAGDYSSDSAKTVFFHLFSSSDRHLPWSQCRAREAALEPSLPAHCCFLVRLVPAAREVRQICTLASTHGSEVHQTRIFTRGRARDWQSEPPRRPPSWPRQDPSSWPRWKHSVHKVCVPNLHIAHFRNSQDEANPTVRWIFCLAPSLRYSSPP